MIPVQLCVSARDGHGHLVDRRYIEQFSEAMLAPEFGSNIPAAILHKLYGIHDDEILSAAPFLCTVCGNKATALCHHAVRDVRSQTGSQAYTVSDQASAICDREGPCAYMVLVRDRQITQAKLDNSIKLNPFDKLCLMCGSDQTRKCGRCQSVYYCGSSCQKQDWPYHKNVCIR